MMTTYSEYVWQHSQIASSSHKIKYQITIRNFQ